MVYCKDCVHFNHDDKFEQGMCEHTESIIKIEPVYGKKIYREAQEMRRDIKLCFSVGRYFEKKKAKEGFFDKLFTFYYK